MLFVASAFLTTSSTPQLQCFLKKVSQVLLYKRTVRCSSAGVMDADKYLARCGPRTSLAPSHLPQLPNGLAAACVMAWT